MSGFGSSPSRTYPDLGSSYSSNPFSPTGSTTGGNRHARPLCPCPRAADKATRPSAGGHSRATGGVTTLYALFLEPEDPAIRNRQMLHLPQTETQEFLAQILERETETRSLDPRLRLLLLDLAVPALRQISPDKIKRLLESLEDLANADGKWTLSEFVLLLVLQRRLDTVLFPNREPLVQYQTLDQIWADCLAVLSALASAGHEKPEAIAYAFRCGAFKLPGANSQSVPDSPPSWILTELPQHLEQLRQAAPKIKQGVINACAHTVLLDSKVTLQEAKN